MSVFSSLLAIPDSLLLWMLAYFMLTDISCNFCWKQLCVLNNSHSLGQELSKWLDLERLTDIKTLPEWETSKNYSELITC